MFDGVIKDRLAIDNITLFDLLFGVSDGFGLAGQVYVHLFYGFRWGSHNSSELL